MPRVERHKRGSQWSGSECGAITTRSAVERITLSFVAVAAITASERGSEGIAKNSRQSREEMELSIVVNDNAELHSLPSEVRADNLPSLAVASMLVRSALAR